MAGLCSDSTIFRQPASGCPVPDAGLLARLFGEAAGHEESLPANLLEALRRSVQADAARLWRRDDFSAAELLAAESGTRIPVIAMLRPSAATAAAHSPRERLCLACHVDDLDHALPADWVRATGLRSITLASLHVGRRGTGALELVSSRPLDMRQVEGWLVWLELALAQAALRDKVNSAEELALTLLRHMPAAALAIDRDGLVRLWNPAAERLYGWNSADVIGHPPRIVPDERRHEWQQVLQFLASGKSAPNMDTVRVHRDGDLVPVILSAAPRFDARGQVVGAIEIHAAASPLLQSQRRTQAECRVREVLQRSAHFEQAAPPVLQTLCESFSWQWADLWLGDADQSTLRHEATWTLHGGPSASAAGARGEPIPGAALAEEVWRSGKPQFAQSVESGAASAQGTARLPAAATRGIGLPLRYRDRTLGVLTIRDPDLDDPDYDDRQSLETMAGALGQFAELMELRSRLAQTEAKLRQAQKMDAVGLLAGGIAHDFNNVLTVILSYSEIAQEEVDSDHPAHEMLAEIHNAGLRAASMTRKLLTFSRQQGEEVACLDLNRMVTDLERMLRRLMGPNIVLETELQSGLGAIRGDASQIDQVLVNFVVNARDAMEGSGRIAISTRNVSITSAQAHEIPNARSGDYVVLSVTDTGCGMDQATKQRIFEPFFTTKGVGRGTGMGLATVAGIVRQAGGFIQVDTAPGKGTSMIVYFPRVRETLATLTVDSCPTAPPSGSETILLLEEDEIIRALMRRVLATRGYSVHEAASAEEALRLIDVADPPVSLVLTNLTIPGLSGHQLVRLLKERDPAIKVLFVVGSSEDQQLAADCASSDTLQKPFTGDALSRKIRMVLDH